MNAAVNAAVTDHAARNRFELALAGGTAFIDYRRVGQVLYLNHAEVPTTLSGHGVGTRLAQETLDLIRSRGERVVPVCSFIQDFVRRHPTYSDLCASPE